MKKLIFSLFISAPSIFAMDDKLIQIPDKDVLQKELICVGSIIRSTYAKI